MRSCTARFTHRQTAISKTSNAKSDKTKARVHILSKLKTKLKITCSHAIKVQSSKNLIKANYLQNGSTHHLSINQNINKKKEHKARREVE
jgi:hypothetical protein